MEKIVLVTGGFDPLHSGHLAYFKEARKLGDKLPISERYEIVSSLKFVDNCILFNDEDDTAIEAIKNIKMLFPYSQIIFANGGDRTGENIPEMVFDDVIFTFGVGGNSKKNSSSWILQKWTKN
jgi:cytidyltransferase-like protein